MQDDNKSYRIKRLLLVIIPLIIIVSAAFIILNRPEPVEVLAIKEQPYSEKIIAVGQLKPEQETTLIAEVSGTIKSFVGAEGDIISSGTVLVEIENQIRSEYDSASTEYSRLRSLFSTAQTDYNNAKALFDVGAISQMELTAKQNAVQSVLSQQKAAKLQLEIAADNTGKYRVTVPWDSVLLKAYVASGDYVSIGQSLADLGSSKGYQVVADLDEKYFPVVKEGLPVLISVGDNREQFRSEIESITPQINTETGMFQVRVSLSEQFPYQASNLTVDLEFLLMEKDRAIVIPEKYLLSGADFPANNAGFVLLLENEKVKKQPIQITAGFSNNILITEGLKEGDLLLFPGDGFKEGDSVAQYKEGERG